MATYEAARTVPATTKATKNRKTRLSTARSGRIAWAHDPKTASPEANRPPKRTSATTEIATVRTTGHRIDTLDMALRVRPSRGSPRTPARIHEAQPPTMDGRPRASVRAAIARSPATPTAMTASHSAARRTTRLVRATASRAGICMARSRRWTEAVKTRAAESSRMAKVAMPRFRSGTTRAASRPIPTEPRTRRGCGASPRSGQRSPKTESTNGGAGTPAGCDGAGVGGTGTVVMGRSFGMGAAGRWSALESMVSGWLAASAR